MIVDDQILFNICVSIFSFFFGLFCGGRRSVYHIHLPTDADLEFREFESR